MIVLTLRRSIYLFFFQLNNLKQTTPLPSVIIVTLKNVQGPPRKGQREKGEDRQKYDKRKIIKKKLKKKWKGLSLRILPRRNSFDDKPLY